MNFFFLEIISLTKRLQDNLDNLDDCSDTIKNHKMREESSKTLKIHPCIQS